MEPLMLLLIHALIWSNISYQKGPTLVQEDERRCSAGNISKGLNTLYKPEISVTISCYVICDSAE